MNKKIILLTNDDGVDAEGILTLKKVLDKEYKCVVFAPDSEKSGTSHSLTLDKPLRIKEIDKDIFSVSGFTADCVYAGLREVKPDLVVSGVNKGANLGIDVFYSGTVAGARQASIDGVLSISVSLVIDGNKETFYYEDSAIFTNSIIKKIFEKGYHSKRFININYPNVSKDKIKGVKVTSLGERKYIGDIQWGKDPRGKKYCWLWGDYASFEEIEGTDCVAAANNFISVSPLLLDVTDYNMIEEVKSWGL